MRILLVKNPAGANEVLRTLALEPGEHDLLGVLNDQIADGRDVSWIWDADFEQLAGRVRQAICSGSRAADLAARLKYAGVDPAAHPDRSRAFRGAGSRPGAGAEAPLYALPTYTAMLACAIAGGARGGSQLVDRALPHIAPRGRPWSGTTWSAVVIAPIFRCGARLAESEAPDLATGYWISEQAADG